jgi:hypothetical protein
MTRVLQIEHERINFSKKQQHDSCKDRIVFTLRYFVGNPKRIQEYLCGWERYRLLGHHFLYESEETKCIVLLFLLFRHGKDS